MISQQYRARPNVPPFKRPKDCCTGQATSVGYYPTDATAVVPGCVTTQVMKVLHPKISVIKRAGDRTRPSLRKCEFMG